MWGSSPIATAEGFRSPPSPLSYPYIPPIAPYWGGSDVGGGLRRVSKAGE